jgi:hypothetical protein
MKAAMEGLLYQARVDVVFVGLLVAASPVQVVVDSFLPSNQLEPKPKKLKDGFARTREFMSLYPEGAENIKGVLKQNVKEKEEWMEQRLEE